MRKYFIGLFLISIFLVTNGAVCSKSGEMPAAVTISYWSPELDIEDISPIIESFQIQYPYVKIQYKKLNKDEYEDMLISSWAKGQGPDIFSLKNSFVAKYYEYIEPMPASTTVKTVTTTKRLGKTEINIKDKVQKSLTPAELKNQYIDAVYPDVVKAHQGEKEKQATAKIFGLPLSSDTLALYWNRDILNQAKISLPASDWQAIVDHTKLTTKIDKNNNIIQSGVALGTSKNVNNYFDILSLLMMQYGADMTQDNKVSFHYGSEEKGKHPGQDALDFYIKFAQPDWESYTWNDAQPMAIDAFATGKTAYFIGYHSQLADIKQLNPNLNFDLAPIPQISNNLQINYTDYWVETVSKRTKNRDIAWAFLQYLTNETNSEKYLLAAKKPAIRRTLINKQIDNYELAIFAEQALTAKSWYRGKDPANTLNLFSEMIDNAREGNFPLAELINETAQKVQLTM